MNNYYSRVTVNTVEVFNLFTPIQSLNEHMREMYMDKNELWVCPIEKSKHITLYGFKNHWVRMRHKPISHDDDHLHG